MRRPPMVLILASASAMLLFGCEGGQPLEPLMTGEDINAARMSGGSEVAAPSNALATAYSAVQIDVSWRDNSSNETSFHIYRSPTGEAGTFAFIAYTDANTTTYRNQALEAGVRYCYAVLAVGVIRKKTINSVFSNAVCATTAPPVAAPSNAAAVAASDTRIEIQWQDNSSNETHFEVHRSVWLQGNVFSLHTVTSENVTSYSDQGLSPATEYCYKIRAVQVIGDQVIVWPFSNTACARPLPTAASSTTATPENSQTVVVDWTAFGSYFRIERSTDGGVVWNTAGTAYDTRQFRDYVQPEQTVCYRVVNYNTGGDAPPSNTDCTAPPARPTEVAWSTVDASTVEVTWRDNSSVEDGYQVHEMYPDCWRDGDGVEYCEGYLVSVIAVLPANTTSFRKTGVGSKVAVYAMKDGGFSTGSVSP
ncbi:MAG: fibronectin type III domain-containing protein [Gemmatimonadota bacterium]|nr:fibronectin type III domain-containing protein [Gemmatimonadota bacterium]